ncbi:MAG: hypothetical protein EBR02_00430 [Alphaproteobacteria bacterium]|nr:hypothetical protein [Alphaproteobacteria bacterium]
MADVAQTTLQVVQALHAFRRCAVITIFSTGFAGQQLACGGGGDAGVGSTNTRRMGTNLACFTPFFINATSVRMMAIIFLTTDRSITIGFAYLIRLADGACFPAIATPGLRNAHARRCRGCATRRNGRRWRIITATRIPTTRIAATRIATITTGGIRRKNVRRRHRQQGNQQKKNSPNCGDVFSHTIFFVKMFISRFILSIRPLGTS